ncbi:hypothetical protein ABZP36_020972 [Zizania latifolia]
MKVPASFRPPRAYKPAMVDRFRDLPPSSLGLLTALLALDQAARGTAAQALQSSVRSTSPCVTVAMSSTDRLTAAAAVVQHSAIAVRPLFASGRWRGRKGEGQIRCEGGRRQSTRREGGHIHREGGGQRLVGEVST